MDLNRPPTCLFRREIDAIRQQVEISSLNVTDVFSLSERLVAVLLDPSRCDDGCYQSLAYAQILIDSVARLMDFLDKAWSTTCRKNVYDQTDVMHSGRTVTHRGNASISSSSSSHTAASAVVGWHTAASVGRFILDDSERDLLLQEMLRATTVSMNDVVADIHHRISQSSRASSADHRRTASDLGHLDTLSGHLLERTYSALARYENPTSA